MASFTQRFLAAAETKGAPVCVGLDPVLDRLPEASRSPAQRIESWCKGVLDAVAPSVPVVKPQLACFERYGASGVAAYQSVVDHAKALGLLVIADAKRGDIGLSSRHYAAGLVEGEHAADALTVNGYLGDDGLQPFIDTAAQQQAGLFVLVRTSNPGGDAFQRLQLADGRTISEAMADLVVELGSEHVDVSGYSLVGAVVGATKPEDARTLRSRMPQQLFLVPGYGAQGGGAEDVRACFNGDGRGAIITASRSVIYAEDIAAAAETFRDEIAAILS